MKIDLNLPPPPVSPAVKPPAEPPADQTLGLGAALKQIRGLRGLSQAELGARVGLAGGSVQAIESGKNRLTVWQLKSMAEALDMELSIGLTPKAKPAEE